MAISMIVEERLNRLKKESFDDLRKMPSSYSEKMKDGKKNIIITVWKSMISDDEVQIVVQLYRPFFLGFGAMNAQGFRKNIFNDLLDLESEDLYDFV